MMFTLQHCATADKYHKDDPRIYAHVGHKGRKPGTICVAKAFKKLKEENARGIIWHEIGHSYTKKKRRGYDMEIMADMMAQEKFGIRIWYDYYKLQYMLAKEDPYHVIGQLRAQGFINVTPRR